MKIENVSKIALPTDAKGGWTDQQLMMVFTAGVTILNDLNKTAIQRNDVGALQVRQDHQYAGDQLGRYGLTYNTAMTSEVWDSLHNGFDLRPVIATFQRKSMAREADMTTLDETFPQLDPLMRALREEISRYNTLARVLMRHSLIIERGQVYPERYRHLLALNPEGREVDQINILQLPSRVRPPRVK